MYFYKFISIEYRHEPSKPLGFQRDPQPLATEGEFQPQAGSDPMQTGLMFFFAVLGFWVCRV